MTAAALTLSGCGKLEYDIPYVVDANVSTYNVVSKQDNKTAVPFASRLCVVSGNVPGASQEHLGDVNAAVLFDLKENEVLYAQAAHDRVSPASLTKVMTALVALKYGNVNQTLTATNDFGEGRPAVRTQARRCHDAGSGASYFASLFRK